MSQLMDDDECNRCMHYVAFVADNKSWKCELCHLVEDVMELNDGTYNLMWGRYQLPCLHQAHIRCYRKWCKLINMVSCPTCKYKIEEIPTNEYCNVCMDYGHPTSNCEM